MIKPATQDLLFNLHEAFAQVLMTELQSADPDPKVMAVIRGFLNDNGISLDVCKLSKGDDTPHPLDTLSTDGEVLPFRKAD